MALKIPTIQTGLEKSIRNAVKNVSARGGLNLNINSQNFSRPLGKITGSVSEFNKSLEASNARVLAFGASVGIIQGVQKAFASLLSTAIQVEQQMTEINVVMGLTNNQLDSFQKGLFKVAKNTAQSFSTVAVAATELARQGLSMEETLKRTNDALILTRLTGLDAANAVSGLTAALNTFNDAGLDSTKILSKMAAVDVQFAVSTEDLIDAVSRSGAVAQDAGVSFDQLLGAVTAAQQTTARGGKVIGNSFKTIFTRVQRSSTITRLEELGIAVRDIQGNTLPAISVLQNLAKTYDTLADTTKAAVAEQVGGVFQINILKAAIKDLSRENSILARATAISSQATDEAYKKNEILNRSLAALTAQAGTSLKELSETLGSLAFSDNLRGLLGFLNDQLSSITNYLNQSNGESMGSDFFKGVIKGIGNVISGPGLILTLAVLGKLFVKTFGFLAGSGKELLGVVSAAQTQKKIQESIVAILAENSALQKRILSQEGNRAAQEKTILTILQAQSAEQAKIAAAARAIAPGISRAGFGASLTKVKSGGHVPNYVSAEERMKEKRGARSGGYTAGSVKSMVLKGEGRVVYNSAEKVKTFPGMKQSAIIPPKSSSAGKKYKESFAKAHGFDPYANKGFVPNYARRYKPTPQNIAHGLIYGKKRALNLEQSDGRLLKESWYSSAPAMATGTELDSIRTLIYKRFLSKNDPTFIKQVEDALSGFGRGVPEVWGGRGKGLVAGMLDDLNLKRAQARGYSAVSKMPTNRVLGPKDPLMGGAMNKGLVPNFGLASFMKNLIHFPKLFMQNLNPFRGARSSVNVGKEISHFNEKQGIMKMMLPSDTRRPANSGLPPKVTKQLTENELIGKNLLEKGFNRRTLRISDLPPDLQKQALAEGKYQVGQGMKTMGPQNFVPTKILEMLGMNRGFVPNYSYMSSSSRLRDFSVVERGKLNNDQKRSSRKLKDYILRRAGLDPKAREFEPPKFDLKMARDGKFVSSLDNPTASRARAAVITSDGKAHLGFWHDDIRDDLARRKIDLKGAKDLELSWANKGLIPNYSAFHYEDNLLSKLPPVYRNADGKLASRINPMKALDFIDYKGLQRIMKKFITGATQDGMNWKGSYGGMPIQDYKKNFGSPLDLDYDRSRGLSSIGDKRMSEILQNPSVTKNFFKYLTGRSPSIDISPGLTPEEKSFFRKEYGSIPSIKHEMDGQEKGRGRQKQLGTLITDFLDAGSKASKDNPLGIPEPRKAGEPPRSGSVAQQILDNYKKTRFGKNDQQRQNRLENLIKENAALDPKLNRFGIEGKGPLQIEEDSPKLKEIRQRDEMRKRARAKLAGRLGPFYPFYPKTGTSGSSQKTNLPDDFIDDKGRVRKYVKFGDFDQFNQRLAEEKIVKQYGSTLATQNKLASGSSSQLKGLIQGNRFASKVKSDLAFKEFENLISRKDNPMTIEDAESAVAKRLSKNQDILNIGSQRSQRMANISRRDELSILEDQQRKRKALDLRREFRIPTFQTLLEEENKKEIKKQTFLEKMFSRFRRRPPSLKSLIGAEGIIPNFMKRRAGLTLSAGAIEPMHKRASKARIKTDDYDETIGLSDLDSLLTQGTFKSINYTSQAGNNLTYTNARWGVNQYKKGAPPPGDYVSYGQMDKATGTRALWVGSTGEGSDAFRRLKLENVNSIVAGGKHYRVDPYMSQGFIPNFAKGRSLANREPAVQANVAGIHPGKNPLTDSFIKAYKDGKISEADLMDMLRGQAKMLGPSGMKMFEAQADYVAMSIKSAPGQIRRNNINDMRSGAVDASKGHVPNFIKISPAFANFKKTSSGMNAVIKPRSGAFKETKEFSSNSLTNTLADKVLSGEITFNQAIQAMYSASNKMIASGTHAQAGKDLLLNFTKLLSNPKFIKELKNKNINPNELNSGFVPNFGLFSPGASKILSTNPQYSGAVKDAISREASFGLTPKVVSAPSLRSSRNPGLAVVNQEQEGGLLSNARKLHGGLRPNKKSSAIPNYAISGGEAINIRRTAVQQVSADGLNAMQRSFQEARSAIDRFSASTKKSKAFLDNMAKSYATNANSIKEANLREKARLGTLKKESSERQNFARQMFRREALQNVANQGGALGSVASNLLKEGNKMEAKLLEQMAIASDPVSGNKEVLKTLKRLDSTMDMSARGMKDQPRMQARAIESTLLQAQRNNKREEKFKSREGFSKKQAQSFFAQDYLGQKGIATSDKSEAKSIIASLGKAGRKEYNQFLQSQGVMSSNRSLARGGLQTGQFRSLVGNNDGRTFIKGLGKLESAIKTGDTKSAKRLESFLMRKSTSLGVNADSSKALQGVVSATKAAIKDEERKNNQKTRQETARNMLANKQNFRGSFVSGQSGAGLKGAGMLGSAGFRAGQLTGKVAGGAKNFLKGSGGMFGGQFGLGMSFIAPMIAGMIGNKTPREDRAVFNKETGAFDVQDRGMDTASTVLMAGGMGALFGPGGLIAGATIGFISSMKSATLTIDEQIRVREKEISIIGQNAQAVQNIQNLSNSRAQAFAKGDSVQVANLDSMINRNLSGITDDEILRKVANATGDENAMSKIQAQLQDQMTVATSTQNFGLAIKNKNEKNAGVALGSIIAQSIRQGDVDSGTALSTLGDIRSNVAARKKAGTMRSTEELNEIRRRSENRQGMVSGLQTTGATIGGILGFMAGGGLAALTGGAGLAAVGATTAGGAALGQGIGRTIEVLLAKSSMDELTSMGADEIRMFDKLVQSGALTETAAQAMIAAFREGDMGMDQIAEEAERAVKSFDKISRASDIAATALFQLDKKFRQALNRMVVGAEVDKIQNAASIRGEKSNANFMSQYMSPSQAASFTGEAESKILQREAANKFSEFQRQSDIDFTRKFQSNKTLASFTPRQKQSVTDTVENEGLGSILKMLQTRKFEGNFDLSLNRESVNKIAEELGVPEPGVTSGLDRVDLMKRNASTGGNLFTPDLTDKSVKSNLSNLLGVNNEDEISNAVIKLQQNLDGILQGDKLRLNYTADLDPKDAAQLQEQIKDRELQASILKAQIEAQKKALSIQIAQNRIQTQIQTQLEKLSVGQRNAGLVDDLEMIKERGRSESYSSRLQMESGQEFRGFTDDSTESARQASIRKKIFEEEVRLQKAENLLTLKREAQRLLSEKNLVDALNGLSSKMDEALKQAATEGNPPPQSDSTVDSRPNAPTPTTRQGLPSSSGAGSKYENEIEKRGIRIDKLKNQRANTQSKLEGTGASAVDRLSGNLDAIRGARDQIIKSQSDYGNLDFINDGFSKLTFGLIDSTSEDQTEDFEEKFGQILKNLDDESGRSDIIRNDEGEFRSLQEILNRLNQAAKETDENYKRESGKQAKRTLKIQELEKEISSEEKAIETLINKASNESSKESDKNLRKAIEGNIVNIDKINLAKSKIANDQIQAAESQEEIISTLENTVSQISKDADPLGILADQVVGLSTISDQLDEGIKQMMQKYNISEIKDAMEAFDKTLKFSDYSQDSMSQFRELSKNLDVNAQGAANAVEKSVGQFRREREFQVISADPTSTRAELERARVARDSVTYGTSDQREQFGSNLDKMAQLRGESLRARIQSTSEDQGEREGGLAELARLEDEMRDLNASTQELAQSMQRTVPRDQGAISEITTNMGSGLSLGMGELEEQSEGIYLRLGQQLPFAFRDGMVDAMQAALNGADDLDAKLSQIGISFLQMIQRAFLESAASRVTSAIGGAFGLANGGYVNRGSGVKDDVPAMLMGGEYVVKKSAVDKYGINFLENLNRGSLEGFSKGGGVNLRIGAPRTAEREEYVDRNKDGNITRYKVTKEGAGINSALTGYAIANDKQIQKYFSDQETQFGQDLATQRQEKTRAENKKRRKKAEKNALWGIALGIVGGALISKGMDYYEGTNFAKRRAKSRENKNFDRQYRKEGKYEYSKGKAAYQQSPAQRSGIKKDIAYFQGQGWEAGQMSDYLRTANGGVQHSITRAGSGYTVSTGYNKGGQVPSMLTGGEYVMSPSAVKTYGSTMMSSINSGTYGSNTSTSTAQPQSQNNVSHGDVNISINVSSSGQTQSNSSELNTPEFAKKVKSAVIEVISKEKRVGGSLR